MAEVSRNYCPDDRFWETCTKAADFFDNLVDVDTSEYGNLGLAIAPSDDSDRGFYGTAITKAENPLNPANHWMAKYYTEGATPSRNFHQNLALHLGQRLLNRALNFVFRKDDGTLRVDDYTEPPEQGEFALGYNGHWTGIAMNKCYRVNAAMGRLALALWNTAANEDTAFYDIDPPESHIPYRGWVRIAMREAVRKISQYKSEITRDQDPKKDPPDPSLNKGFLQKERNGLDETVLPGLGFPNYYPYGINEYNNYRENSIGQPYFEPIGYTAYAFRPVFTLAILLRNRIRPGILQFSNPAESLDLNLGFFRFNDNDPSSPPNDAIHNDFLLLHPAWRFFINGVLQMLVPSMDWHSERGDCNRPRPLTIGHEITNALTDTGAGSGNGVFNEVDSATGYPLVGGPGYPLACELNVAETSSIGLTGIGHLMLAYNCSLNAPIPNLIPLEPAGTVGRRELVKVLGSMMFRANAIPTGPAAWKFPWTLPFPLVADTETLQFYDNLDHICDEYNPPLSTDDMWRAGSLGNVEGADFPAWIEGYRQPDGRTEIKLNPSGDLRRLKEYPFSMVVVRQQWKDPQHPGVLNTRSPWLLLHGWYGNCHGHLDTNSFELNAYGSRLFVDPGYGPQYGLWNPDMMTFVRPYVAALERQNAFFNSIYMGSLGHNTVTTGLQIYGEPKYFPAEDPDQARHDFFHNAYFGPPLPELHNAAGTIVLRGFAPPYNPPEGSQPDSYPGWVRTSWNLIGNCPITFAFPNPMDPNQPEDTAGVPVLTGIYFLKAYELGANGSANPLNDSEIMSDKAHVIVCASDAQGVTPWMKRFIRVVIYVAGTEPGKEHHPYYVILDRVKLGRWGLDSTLPYQSLAPKDKTPEDCRSPFTFFHVPRLHWPKGAYNLNSIPPVTNLNLAPNDFHYGVSFGPQSGIDPDTARLELGFVHKKSLSTGSGVDSRYVLCTLQGRSLDSGGFAMTPSSTIWNAPGSARLGTSGALGKPLGWQCAIEWTAIWHRVNLGLYDDDNLAVDNAWLIVPRDLESQVPTTSRYPILKSFTHVGPQSPHIASYSIAVGLEVGESGSADRKEHTIEISVPDSSGQSDQLVLNKIIKP